MGIDQSKTQRPLVPAAPFTWGEVAPEGQQVRVLRFCLVDRTLTYPVAMLKKWEHLAGEPEILTITAGKEQVVIEGAHLLALCAALDLGRLCEVRPNYQKTSARPGPQIRSINLEAA